MQSFAHKIIQVKNEENREIIVAIKKIPQPFDDKRLAKCAYRELRYLKYLNHQNIIKLIDTFTKATTADEMIDL